MLNCSGDKNEGVIIPCWGGGRRARYVTPDLSYPWEGCVRVVRGREDKKWDEKKNRPADGGGVVYMAV